MDTQGYLGYTNKKKGDRICAVCSYFYLKINCVCVCVTYAVEIQKGMEEYIHKLPWEEAIGCGWEGGEGREGSGGSRHHLSCFTFRSLYSLKLTITFEIQGSWRLIF